jgi:nicotinate-nucleotide adenylyltransferase
MIGIFGGTFNPIHVGHLRAAEEVVEALALERLLFVPSARPPHKRSGGQGIAPAHLRLRWVELAVRDNPRFAVDPIEVERPGPSYLVDTLHALRERHREQGGLVFVVGQDAFSEMGAWHMPREIFRLCHVAVTTRPPVLSGRLGEWLPECVRDDFEIEADGAFARHREATTTIRQVAITAIDVSASAIRERIQAGRSIRYLLPEAVRSAVLASGAYLGDAPAAQREDAAPRSASGGES